MRKLYRIFLISIFFLSCKSNTNHNIKTGGYWYTVDYDKELAFKVISIDGNNNFSMRVTFNQMDLKGKLQKADKSNTYKVIYEEANIGRGPTYLDWNNFEKDSSVAIFKVVDSLKANIEWLGFYNKKTKLREWDNNMDYHGKLVKKNVN